VAKATLPREAADAWLKLLVAPETQAPAVDPAATLTPRAWAEQHATLVLAEGRVPFRPYAYQAAILDDPSPRRLILKARQTGISNTVAIEALHAALTQPDQTILFVSRNQDAARELIRYVEHSLGGLSIPMPALVSENQGSLEWANGSRIVSLPSNPSTGRGVAARRVYLDEFAFCAYDQLIYESIVPTLSHGGQLTVLSTPKGRANMFFRLWSGLEGGAWSRHEIHWQDCPRYTPEWAETMRANMTRQAWAQEYDCDFIASGDAVFDAADLARCADGYVPDADGCDRTVTAWDIGRRQDHTVGITLGLRGETWHVVAFERFLEPYPVVQAKIERRALAFPRGQHWVESNGVGDPVIENLACRVQPFTTTAKTKVQAIQALQLLVQQGRFKHAEPQLGRELSLYQFDDSQLIQDSVMAAAIAAHATQHPVRGFASW
jgi:hypothetical protein